MVDGRGGGGRAAAAGDRREGGDGFPFGGDDVARGDVRVRGNEEKGALLPIVDADVGRFEVRGSIPFCGRKLGFFFWCR